MNDVIIYTIDGVEKTFSIKGSSDFKYGKDEVLSAQHVDVTFDQPWYDEGYTEIDLVNAAQFKELKEGLTEAVAQIVREECSIDTEGFTLEKYHQFVKGNEDHFKVVRRTRDLFPKDFGFPVNDFIPLFENMLNFPLSDKNPKDGEQIHIIVRINRPQSNDFNPPHKDVYEAVDKDDYLPSFVNFWIPIAGVNEKSNLPLAPRSHRINENQVFRTFDGAIIQGNKYRVRMIKSWNGESRLTRSTVKYGQVLIFSGHLIHGLAVNDNTDLTRVALEFRLFKPRTEA